MKSVAPRAWVQVLASRSRAMRGMIKHEWKRWQPWQARVFGLGLAWWLAVAPDVVGELWKLCAGYELSDRARDCWLDVSCGLLVVGVIAAVATWAASDCRRARLAARWFLLSACPLLVLIVLSAAES